MTDDPTRPAAPSHRCGSACIFGAPNAGKSTLVNRLVGQKIAIVTNKVQTTRFQMRGIVISGATQIILIDTPGIFSPRRRLDRAMVRAAWEGAREADARVHLVDASAYQSDGDPGPGAAARRMAADDDRILIRLGQERLPTVLALNKIDLIARETLLPLTSAFMARFAYAGVFMISGGKGAGVAKLKEALAALMPDGPWAFPEDQVMDAPMRVLAAEITREKLMLRLHEELPYAASVETDEWREHKDGSVRIQQTIYVAREGHRKIALGREGRAIRDIGLAARKEMQTAFDRTVHLFLHVKVDANWQEQRRFYEPFGLHFDA